MPAQSTSGIDLSGEKPGVMTKAFDGFWLLSSMHRTGGSKWLQDTNNRAFVFRLEDEGKPVLCVVHAVDPAVIPEVQALEKSTDLRVAYVVSPSGRRHLFLKPWHGAFTEAKILRWPARTAVSYHDAPGYSRSEKCQEELRRDVEKVVQI